MNKDHMEKYKKAYHDLSIPNELIDESIAKGFLRAKREQVKKPRKKWLLGIITAAIILVGFISSMQIIDFIRDNRGLLDAVNSEYYQQLDATSEEKDGVKMVVDGVIADEHGMAIFYTIQSKDKRNYMRIEKVNLKSNGEELSFRSVSEGAVKTSKNNQTFSGMIEYYFKDPMQTTSFELDVEAIGGAIDSNLETDFHNEFTIPFQLEKELLTKKIYELNQIVVIEDQEIFIKEVIVYPLRAAIQIELSKENSKKILNFNDLRLVDEKGDTWGSIQNGVTAIKTDEEQLLYLQSNYFQNPKELYLEMNKVEAIEQSEGIVIVDPKAEEIIKQPKENYLKSVEMDGRYLVFKTDIDLMEQPINFGGIFNENDEPLLSTASYHQRDEFGFRIDDYDKHEGLIYLELSHYPRWINGDIKIRLQ